MQLKAYRATREDLAKRVLADAALYPELFNMAMDTSWPHHFKACWVLDLVLEENMSLLDQDKSRFCRKLPDFTQEGALRSISRITWNAIKKEKTGKGVSFSYPQKEEIATVCFDWLVSDVKVASKANAIYILYVLGREIDWIYEDLVPVLEKDFGNHSPGYKSAARNTLKRLRH